MRFKVAALIIDNLDWNLMLDSSKVKRLCTFNKI